jgi:hypothetical protein
MTIASFCRDELLAHGPLTLDTLATRAVAAGATRAANPASAVRQAIQYDELELADGRWVTPLQLLEGRCLTTPSLRGDDLDTSDLDLDLLRLAARGRPIPIRGGGELARSRYDGGWDLPDAVADPGPDELLCLRIEGGELVIATIAARDTESLPSRRFVAALNSSSRRDLPSWPRSGSTNGVVADLVTGDDSLLRAPAPPLSWCSDELRKEVARREASRRERELERWQPYAYRDTDGLLTLRLTQQQAELLQRIAFGLRDELPDPARNEVWFPSGSTPLRLLP